MDEKNYTFQATSEMPYAAKSANGYELESNDRTMRLVIHKRTFFDTEQNVQLAKIEAVCLVKEGNGWVRCNGATQANSEQEIFERLRRNEGFTKAIREYEEYCLFRNCDKAAISE